MPAKDGRLQRRFYYGIGSQAMICRADTDLMAEERTTNPLEALQREKARILKEAADKAAAIDRDLAELNRLAAKYGFELTAGPTNIALQDFPRPAEPPAPSTSSPKPEASPRSVVIISNSAQPKIEGAPGLVWRKYKYQWEARWAARTDLVHRGYRPPFLKLWLGRLPDELTDVEVALIQSRCQMLQDEMLAWEKSEQPTAPTQFDGTITSLINCYRTDEMSGFQKLRFNTRQNYNALFRRIAQDLGSVQIKDIDARRLLAEHEKWAEGGRLASAHGLIAMLRIISKFGATFLKDKACRELRTVLTDLEFPTPRSRKETLTAAQATLIREKAWEVGLPSMALAQALQFDFKLNQKDVIGEWVPINEPGPDDVVSGNMKWIRGIRWDEIDEDFVLRHISANSSSERNEIVLNLMDGPMVREELNKLLSKKFGGRPSSGPVIVHEKPLVPWSADSFRRVWRELADKCGIPKKVRNMDSRADARNGRLMNMRGMGNFGGPRGKVGT